MHCGQTVLDRAMVTTIKTLIGTHMEGPNPLLLLVYDDSEGSNWSFEKMVPIENRQYLLNGASGGYGY